MSDDIQIRPGELSDWPIIADFNCRLAWESEGKVLDRATIERGVRELLAVPSRGRYFVACVSGEIVGQLMHTYEWSDWRCGEIWWLQSVYVRPEFRRQGVFTRLFRHIEELASHEAIGLRLYVEDQNERAQQTYASLGMEPAGYSVYEKLKVRL